MKHFALMFVLLTSAGALQWTMSSSTPGIGPSAMLSANPISITAGQSSMLTWTSTNATGVLLNGVSVALSGSQSVSPSTTTTYNLVASGPGGHYAISVTVSVGLPPPQGVPWAGIVDPSRAIDWSQAGVKINGVLGIPSYTRDCGTIQPTGADSRQANTQYAQGAKISVAGGNNINVWTATTGGTTFDGTAPNPFPTTVGATSQDGTVIWTLVNSTDIAGDDAARVQNAIINCDNSSGVGGVVHLAAGHFYFFKGLAFNKGFYFPWTSASPAWGAPVNNVELKGAGPMQTYLHFRVLGQCNAAICVMGSQRSYNVNGTTPGPAGSSPWLGAGTSVGTYAKGATQLISGAWAGAEPQANDVVIMDQNSDIEGICPAPWAGSRNYPLGTIVFDSNGHYQQALTSGQTSGANEPAWATSPDGATTSNGNVTWKLILNTGNCTGPGITFDKSTGTVTFTTSNPHGFYVGQCIGTGSIPIINAYTQLYNNANNPGAATRCAEIPKLPAWWTVTAVGCIVSNSFTDSCSGHVVNAFQVHMDNIPASCIADNTACPSPSGGGYVMADNGGLMVGALDGANMALSATLNQVGRMCPGVGAFTNAACEPGEISVRNQMEIKRITTVLDPGQGSCPATTGIYKCYIIDAPVYSNNWRSPKHPGLWWTGALAEDDGLEGFTALEELGYYTGSKGNIKFQNAVNGWVRNTRAVGVDRNHVWSVLASHISILDNYVAINYGGVATTYIFEQYGAADVLVMNNICQHVVSCVMTQYIQGQVAAYNYGVDSGFRNSWPPTNMMPMMTFMHAQSINNLFESNNTPGTASDNAHGSGGLGTAFRGRQRGTDRPARRGNRVPSQSRSFNRGFNWIGNVVGTPQATPGIAQYYQSSSAEDMVIFGHGAWRLGFEAPMLAAGMVGSEPLPLESLLRWGNYDAMTRTTRWCATGSDSPADCSCGSATNGCTTASEIPGAFPFLSANAVPANHTLPPSFFLSAAPTFWTTTWGTPPWPAIGPDVTASGALDTTCGSDPVVSAVTVPTGTGPGSYIQCDGIGHHAYQIPAQICYANQPIDLQWQQGSLTPFQQKWAGTFTVTNAVYNSANGGTLIVTVDNNTLDTTPPPATTGFSVVVELTGVNPSDYNGVYTVFGSTVSSMTLGPFLNSSIAPYQSGGTITTPNVKQYDAHACYPNLTY